MSREAKTCPNCKREYLTVLDREHPELPIQQEFPSVPKWQREQFISGICSDRCWDEFLGVPHSEPQGYVLNIDAKLLDEQLRAMLESNLPEEIKEGLHSLLGEIIDQTYEGAPVDIVITVKGGLVEDVEGLPKGMDYTIDDQDKQEEEEDEHEPGA